MHFNYLCGNPTSLVAFLNETFSSSCICHEEVPLIIFVAINIDFVVVVVFRFLFFVVLEVI